MVDIECVGVWDTVGSLGIPGDIGKQLFKGRYSFHDVQLGSNVRVALHAIAIDEKRGPFAPTLWVSPTGEPRHEKQIVEQVWFPGAHSNVGGSYPDTVLSDITFDWMVQRVVHHTKLALNWKPSSATANKTANGVGIDSRTKLYLVSRLFPYQRIINGHVPPGGGLGGWIRDAFESIDRRYAPPNGLKTINEALHLSALDRWKYGPVPNDCKNPRGCSSTYYRPATLATVVATQGIPLVDWAGNPVPPRNAARHWPAPIQAPPP